MRAPEIGAVREIEKLRGFAASRIGIGRHNPCIALLCCQPLHFNRCDMSNHPCENRLISVCTKRLVEFDEDREKDNFGGFRVAVPSFGRYFMYEIVENQGGNKST